MFLATRRVWCTGVHHIRTVPVQGRYAGAGVCELYLGFGGRGSDLRKMADGMPARRRGTRRGSGGAAGVRDAEIARCLRVNQSTVLRHLGPAGAQGQLPLQQDAAEPTPGMPRPPQPGSGPVPEAEPGREGTPEPGPAADAGRGAGGHGAAGPVTARRRPGRASPARSCRYAGAMLLHAFAGRAGPGRSWPPRRAGSPPAWRCCRRSARASRWARRPWSSSSTWPPLMRGRWPGWARCPGSRRSAAV
jgi:hypothetical protein